MARKSIYDKPTRALMLEFAQAELKPGESFPKKKAVAWFRDHYPKLKSITVSMHVDGMAVNSTQRKHHPQIHPGLGWDLFFKLPNGQFRLWDKNTDPAPIYRDDLIGKKTSESDVGDENEQEEATETTSPTSGGEFAYEQHLRDYLAKNLNAIEPGLRLYEEEEFNGVEFPVGGRFIDLLAVDAKGNFVVIELKVSRGYDRTIGQILRYMGWIQKNLAADKKVRGIIVASDITDDLRLATSRISDVKLMEYEISFKLKPVASDGKLMP